MLIVSVLGIGFGLLLALGEIDEERIRRWIVWSLLTGAIACLAIDFLHWFIPPQTFTYRLFQSMPALLLVGGILLKRREGDPILRLLIRWSLGYIVATLGASILMNYKGASNGWWYWLFGDLYVAVAIGIGAIVVTLAIWIFTAPAWSFRSRLST
jgi:hypothetical protein